MIISLFSQVLTLATAGLGDALRAYVKVPHSFISTSRARNLGRGRLQSQRQILHQFTPCKQGATPDIHWLKIAPVPLYLFMCSLKDVKNKKKTERQVIGSFTPSVSLEQQNWLQIVQMSWGADLAQWIYFWTSTPPPNFKNGMFMLRGKPQFPDQTFYAIF